jgi:hypothetical protein
MHMGIFVRCECKRQLTNIFSQCKITAPVTFNNQTKNKNVTVVPACYTTTRLNQKIMRSQLLKGSVTWDTQYIASIFRVKG